MSQISEMPGFDKLPSNVQEACKEGWERVSRIKELDLPPLQPRVRKPRTKTLSIAGAMQNALRHKFRCQDD